MLLALLAAGGWSVPASAQEPAPAPAPAGPVGAPAAADALTDELVVIPGDQFTLRVLDEPDVSGVYTIRDDGNILVPVAHEIHLAGLTVAQASERVREAISVFIAAPELSLELSSRAPRRIYVSGQVMGRGTLEWAPSLTLSKALSLAGGPSPLADLTSVRLKRGEEERTIDLEAVLVRGDFTADVTLQPEDYIVVLPRPRCVLIGPVPGAGEVYIGRGETLYQVFSRLGIMAAAGPAAVAASRPELKSIRVVRDDRYFLVNLDVIRTTGDTTQDLPLENGDRIVVSERGEVYVAGAVATPGPLDVQQAETAAKAVLSAGGVRTDAALDRCMLLRDGESGRLNLAAVLIDGMPRDDVDLRSGDLLIVPENRVLVSGAVTTPGPRGLPWPSKLSEAILAAGGPTMSADLKRVTILRNQQPTTVDISGLVQGAAGGGAMQDPKLEPYDVVVVPEAWVSASGEVARPGVLPYRQAPTLQQLLASSGGVTDDADLTAVYINRAGQTIRQDITSLVREGDVRADMALEPGDDVIIPEGLGRRIYVTGQIGVAGGTAGTGGAIRLRYEEAPDIARAIAGVTGVLTGGGDLTQVRVLRGSEVIMVDLHALYYENDSTQNVPLKPGDTIWIPANETSYVYIFGAVAAPGQIPYFPTMTLTQALAAAGGPPLAGASTNSIKIVRGTGADRKVLTIPWGQLWENPKDQAKRDPVLERGDIILVEEKADDKRWRRIDRVTGSILGPAMDTYVVGRSLFGTTF